MRNKRILNCSIRIPHLELIESGIPKEFHHFLKYQHVTREEAYKLVGYKLSGWVVLFCNLKGNPYLHQGKPFYRIKPEPQQLKDNDLPKYLTSKDAGSRPYFSRLATEKKYKTCKKLFITEGEKKADSLTHYDFPCIALSGVNSWKDKRSGESKPLPELEALNWKNRQVYLVFDSDIVSKIQVLQALQSFCEFLKGKEAKIFIILLPTELYGEKNGADDFNVEESGDKDEELFSDKSWDEKFPILKFWGSDEEKKPDDEFRYRVRISPMGDFTKVYLDFPDGSLNNSKESQQIIKIIYEQLK